MVSDLETFAHKECKIAAAKRVFYIFFFSCSLCLNIFFAPISQSPVSKLFRFLEEKKGGRKEERKDEMTVDGKEGKGRRRR